MSKMDLVERVGKLIKRFGKAGKTDVKLITTNTVEQLAAALPKGSAIVTDSWVLDNLIKPLGVGQKFYAVSSEDVREGNKILKEIDASNVGVVVGFGGGRPIDIAKYVAAKLEKQLYIVPTAPSHDGISSGVSALLVNGKKVSKKTTRPTKVIVHTPFWEKAPEFLVKSGICDLLGKITALQDVSLAIWGGEEIDKSSLAYSLAALLKMLNFKGTMEELGQALVLSGESMKFNSRCASGSEHEVEKLLAGIGVQGTHGQLVGFGTLVAAKVYQDNADIFHDLFFDSANIYNCVKEIFSEFGVLDFALDPIKKLGKGEYSDVCKKMEAVSEVRPERYTLWNVVNSKDVEWEGVFGSLVC